MEVLTRIEGWPDLTGRAHMSAESLRIILVHQYTVSFARFCVLRTGKYSILPVIHTYCTVRYCSTQRRFFFLPLSVCENKGDLGIQILPMDEGTTPPATGGPGTPARSAPSATPRAAQGILAAAATSARKDGGNSRERVRTTEDEAGRLRQIDGGT